MGVADALGPLLDAETPRRSSVSTAKRADAQTARRSDAQTAGRLDAQTPKRRDVQTPRSPELPLQGTAKSKHPDFAKKTLYLRKSTVRDAFRRYEDEYGGSEESEMVEMLLREYAHGGAR